MVFVSMLKNQITNLNEELVKKNETINELKKNKNSTKFTTLKNNFMKNYTELAQVKKENEFMKTKIEDVNHLLLAEKEDNLILKNKLQDFQDKYYIYKDNTAKKTTALENIIAKMRTKERECKIFHIRKGGITPIQKRQKKREFSSDLDEKYENELDNNDNNNENDHDKHKDENNESGHKKKKRKKRKRKKKRRKTVGIESKQNEIGLDEILNDESDKNVINNNNIFINIYRNKKHKRNTINILKKHKSKSKDKLILDKVEKVMEYKDDEINALSYSLALIHDKRTYWQYYISLLKTRHNFIFSFFQHNNYNSTIIQIDL